MRECRQVKETVLFLQGFEVSNFLRVGSGKAFVGLILKGHGFEPNHPKWQLGQIRNQNPNLHSHAYHKLNSCSNATNFTSNSALYDNILREYIRILTLHLFKDC